MRTLPLEPESSITGYVFTPEDDASEPCADLVVSVFRDPVPRVGRPPMGDPNHPAVLRAGLPDRFRHLRGGGVRGGTVAGKDPRRRQLGEPFEGGA